MDAIFAAGAGVLLLGEAGIGKTALARRLAERAAGGGTAVIQVVGRAVSSGAPFEAFAGVLRGERSADPVARGSGPAVEGGASAAEVTAAEVTAQDVTAAEVAARVAAAAAGARLLLVVDDVDLLDDGSARVLLHLAGAGATVVATARSAPLPGVIERLWRDGHCERIELAGLSDEAGELLETVLDAPADLAASDTFVRRAQGNPLPRAASASRRPSASPVMPIRRTGRCRPRCCSPRYSPTPAAAMTRPRCSPSCRRTRSARPTGKPSPTVPPSARAS